MKYELDEEINEEAETTVEGKGEDDGFLDDSFRLYMAGLSEHQVLSRKQEEQLCTRTLALSQNLSQWALESEVGRLVLIMGVAQRLGLWGGRPVEEEPLPMAPHLLLRAIESLRATVRDYGVMEAGAITREATADLVNDLGMAEKSVRYRLWTPTMGVRIRRLGEHSMFMQWLGPDTLETAVAKGGDSLDEWQRLSNLEELIALRDRLVGSTLRLVLSLAKRFQNQGLAYPDLVQEGNIGLLRAVESFDYRRGKRFASHASWFVRKAITKALHEKGRLIRLSEAVIKQLQAMERFKSRYRLEKGSDPTERELATHLDIPLEELRELLVVSAPIASLDEPMTMEGEPARLGDNIADEKQPSLAQIIQEDRLRALLEEIVSELPDLEQKIVAERFGLRGEVQKTHQEVADAYGVSRDRVRTLEKRAVLRLRKLGRSRGLTNFLGDLED